MTCQRAQPLLQPLLSDPSVPLPPPIIPPLESSRPPVYSPEMTALMESTFSRNGPPRTAKQLQHPPILPARANPESSDAKILGPLSKRREVNLRWRFFEKETAKIQPPIEASRVHFVQASVLHDKSTETSTIEGQLTPPPVGFQGTSVLHDLEAIASPNPNLPKHTRNPVLRNPTDTDPSSSTVNRFIRRQHRKLLRKIPILTYSKHPLSPVGKYQVSLSPLAYSGSPIMLTSAVPMADEADLAWLRLPPPPPESILVMKSIPSQGPEMNSVAEKNPKLDQHPQVDEKLKYDSNLADGSDPSKDIQCPTTTPNQQVESKPRPRVGKQLKTENRAGKQPRTEKSQTVRKPGNYSELKRKIRLWPLGLPSWVEPDRTNEPLIHPGRRPAGNSKGVKHSDKMAGERSEREKFPPRSRPTPPTGIRVFKGALVKGGPDKSKPQS